MSRVSPVGSLFETSPEGHIVNPCRPENIRPPWDGVVGDVAQEYRHRFGERLHGVYLRGSVPRGTAIEGFSDLDSFALLRREAEPPPAGWQEGVRARLLAAHPFVSDVEIEIFPFPDASPRTRRLRFMIKTQSLCIAGIDLAPEIPPFRPGPEAVSRAPLIAQQLQEVRAVLEAASTALSGEERSLAGWLMRSILRCGFELVMEAEKAYCRDLYPCFLLFCKHYPDRSRWMRRALDWALDPPAEREAVLAFLDEFGSWLAEEVRLQLGGVE